MNPGNLAVVLNAHQNSPVFRDTLDSVVHHWTNDVLVVADGAAWGQFADADLGVPKLAGFHHGKGSAPYRNMCLGLMKAWQTWGASRRWYCYMEYDCLVCSGGVEGDLDSLGDVWVAGNDHRVGPGSIPLLDRFQRSGCRLHYLLGCCMFLSRDFLAALDRDDFFERFLNFTNFHQGEIELTGRGPRAEAVYDFSEFMYPSLAVHYGGGVGELACWEGGGWRGRGDLYPMRFRPEVEESAYGSARVIHPLKNESSPVRAFHRQARLTDPRSAGTIPPHVRL